MFLKYHSGIRLSIQKQLRWFFFWWRWLHSLSKSPEKIMFLIRSYTRNMNLYKSQLSDQIYTNFTEFFMQVSLQNTRLKMFGKNLYPLYDCSWGNDDSLSYFVIFQRTEDIVFKGDSSTSFMLKLDLYCNLPNFRNVSNISVAVKRNFFQSVLKCLLYVALSDPGYMKFQH